MNYQRCGCWFSTLTLYRIILPWPDEVLKARMGKISVRAACRDLYDTVCECNRCGATWICESGTFGVHNFATISGPTLFSLGDEPAEWPGNGPEDLS